MIAIHLTTAVYAILVTLSLIAIVLLAPGNASLRAYIWWHELILGTLPAESGGLRYAKACLREIELRKGIKKALKRHALLERQAQGMEDALLAMRHLSRGEHMESYTLLDYLAAMSVMDAISQKLYHTSNKEMDL